MKTSDLVKIGLVVLVAALAANLVQTKVIDKF